MNTAFREINEGTTLLADEFGNDLSITEDGTINCKKLLVNNVEILNETGIVGTLLTAAQPNITSLGTLTLLNATTVAAATVTSANIAGTLLTSSQPNITSLGTITTLNAGTINAANISGTLSTIAQPLISSLGVLNELNVDNINIDTNTISSTDTNGNIVLAPKGTGVVQLTKNLDVNLQNITNVNTIGPCFGVSMNGSITSVGNTNITITPGGTGTILAGKALNMQTNNITNVGTITATNIAGNLTTAAQPNITSIGGLTILDVDNISIDGNSIAATNTNGNININANGTGKVIVSTLSTTGMIEVDNLTLNGNTISSANTNGNIILAPNGTGSVQVGGTISSTNQMILNTSSSLGVKIDNLKLPWCQISTPAGVTYFTQNTNLTGMSIVSSGIYTGMFSLTSGTTFSVGENMDSLMIMTATFVDTADERVAGIEFYNNGTFVDSSASAIPYLESNTSFADVCFSKYISLVAGRSYTWRFSSASTGTADLRAFNAFIMRV